MLVAKILKDKGGDVFSIPPSISIRLTPTVCDVR